MEYIALQIYRSANFRQKRQIFQVASFVCVYARIYIGSADLVASDLTSHFQHKVQFSNIAIKMSLICNAPFRQPINENHILLAMW